VNPRETFSDEFLNAYVDGELDEAEKARLLEALCHDETLNARVCDLQKVRELLRHAYEQPPTSRQPHNESHWQGAGIAAGVMLAVGTLLGWGLHSYQSPDNRLLDIAQSMQMDTTSTTGDDAWRVVLHVTTADPYRLKTVLDEAEELLADHRRQNSPVEVEILANGRGLDLLRTRTSPYAERIQALQTQYNNVAFKACQRAINRVQREQNITVKLLPAAETVPTAIGEVISRQREGWAYVRI
jgi:uncharacterized protein